MRQIRETIETDPAVATIADLRTELLGPDEVLVVGVVTVRADTTEAIDDVATRLESDIRIRVPTARLVYLRLASAS